MRHLAWLNATPDGSKKSRRKAFKEQDEEAPILELPEIEDAGRHLMSYLFEAGVATSNGMGIVPLSWQEIDAWIEVTGLPLSTWEKLTLKEMSEAYVNEFTQASEKDRPAPYIRPVEEEQIDRKAVADKLRNVFSGLKKKPKHE